MVFDRESIASKYPQSEAEKIREAFQFAEHAHAGQLRASGDAYIIHPFAVGERLAAMNMDADSVCAGLLHDVVDDTPVTLEEIVDRFGADVGFLVEGTGKLGKIKYHGRERQVENLRKMFLAMGQDIRVIIIKLADRWHNMTTLQFLPAEKQKRIAWETLEIYAPIANRLGMGELKGELEDLAFPYVFPREYQWLVNEVRDDYTARQAYINVLQPTLEKLLRDTGVGVLEIHTRAKHYYSLYKKLEKYNFDLNKIYDLVAVRIMVPDIAACYAALGAIHHHYQPLPGRIKDYIAMPKPNGYQSLHTTVVCEGGHIVEVQIRTPQMHEQAEFGVAAHWFYTESNKPKSGAIVDRRMDWINQLKQWQKDMSDSDEFLESLKIDFFNDRIFVYTPNGDVLDLPQGATPIDFAYIVHTQVGHSCVGAKVNGKMVPLDYGLENGDSVEILTQKKKGPSQQWLSFVKTQKARSDIRRWFKQQHTDQKIILGKDMLSQKMEIAAGQKLSDLDMNRYAAVLDKLNIRNWDAVFVAIGEGELRAEKVLRLFFPESVREEPKAPTVLLSTERGPADAVAVAGQKGLLVNLSQCCNPLPGDDIVAYITANRGASIHTIDCHNIKRLKSREKVLPAHWTSRQTMEAGYGATLKIKALDRVGLIRDISIALSDLGCNIISLRSTEPAIDGTLSVTVKLTFDRLSNFDRLLVRLEHIPNIIKTERI